MNETGSLREPCGSIEVTEGALRALAKTRAWVQFLGVVSIVIACFFGLVLLIGLGVLAAKGVAGIIPVVEGAVVVTITVFYAVYWLKYSRALKRLSATDASLDEALEDAFVRQRRLWTFQGVLFIILIVATILTAVFVLLFWNHHALPMTPM